LLGRPGFEFLQQGLGWRLNDLGGRRLNNDRGLILIGRFGNCSNFFTRRRVACRRRRILSVGD
jgi:hypothetical protein